MSRWLLSHHLSLLLLLLLILMSHGVLILRIEHSLHASCALTSSVPVALLIACVLMRRSVGIMLELGI